MVLANALRVPIHSSFLEQSRQEVNRDRPSALGDLHTLTGRGPYALATGSELSLLDRPQSRGVNLVALTGRLKPATRMRAPQAGWGTLAIEVRRRAPADPGMVVVPLVLPPALARVVADELQDGAQVAVLGTLDIDRSRTTVVVQSIESLVHE